MPIRGAKVQIFLLSTHIFPLKLLLFNEIHIIEPQKYLISRYTDQQWEPEGGRYQKESHPDKVVGSA